MRHLETFSINISEHEKLDTRDEAPEFLGL